MPDEFNPYRDSQVLETETVWPEEYSNWDGARRAVLEEKLHAAPETVAQAMVELETVEPEMVEPEMVEPETVEPEMVGQEAVLPRMNSPCIRLCTRHDIPRSSAWVQAPWTGISLPFQILTKPWT